MAFEIPTLDTLSQRLRGLFRAELPGTDAAIWPNNLYVTGKVVAAGLFEAYLRLSWIYRQIFASTADGTHLERHGYEHGVVRKGATAASGPVTLTGTAGTEIPAGSQLSGPGGGLYSVTAAVTVPDGGTASVAVLASTAGSAGNLPSGAAMTLLSGISGLDDAGTVGSAGITGGTDAEGDADFRARILAVKRDRGHGGAVFDYERWALEVEGVARVQVVPLLHGPGTVGVWPLAGGTGAAVIPSDDLVEAVAAHIGAVAWTGAETPPLDAYDQYQGLHPVTAWVFVLKPQAQTVDITIRDLTPDTEAVRAEVLAELADMFDARAQVATAAKPFALSRSWIAEAISAAAGETRHVLVSPVADVTVTPGCYPVLGTVSFEASA